MPIEPERVRVFTIRWKVTVCYIAVTVTVSAVLDTLALVRGW